LFQPIVNRRDSRKIFICEFYAVRTVHFGMKLYNDQANTQVLKFIYLFTSGLHVLGFLIAHLQRQVYNFGSGLSLMGTVRNSRSCTPVSEDGLIESLKHVRQK
jgi:hypothetical protein